MSIVVKDLSYYYAKKLALNDLTLTLGKGFNVLLGPNGAGKSTLFALLTGLSKSTSGSIAINGNGFDKDSAKIMRNMGVVFQQSTLDLDLTIKQNLFYYAALHGIPSSKALSNIESVLSQLKLDSRLNDKVNTLNGGHRRRVEIARALIHKPNILLLDEATAGLDIDSRLLITQYVKSLSRQLDICVLWATHLMDEVDDDDPLIIIDKGKIKQQGICGEMCKQHQANDVFQLYRLLTSNAEVN